MARCLNAGHFFTTIHETGRKMNRFKHPSFAMFQDQSGAIERLCCLNFSMGHMEGWAADFIDQLMASRLGDKDDCGERENEGGDWLDDGCEDVIDDGECEITLSYHYIYFWRCLGVHLDSLR